jgi:hypothetical protein
MKIYRILFVCAAIAIPQLAMATLPFTNDTFGKLEGAVSFCSKVKPESAAKYQEVVRLFVRDVPEKELTEARKTAEYKDGYKSSGAELGKMPKDRAIDACNGLLEPKEK